MTNFKIKASCLQIYKLQCLWNLIENAYRAVEYDLKNNLTVKQKDESYIIAEETAEVSRFFINV
jgi:hypothetical protein